MSTCKIKLAKTRKKRLNKFKLYAKAFVSKKRIIKKEDFQELYYYFSKYLKDPEDRVLVFYNPMNNRVTLKRYMHKFLRINMKKLFKRLDRLFAKASEKYREGVFLTITMDSKKYTNILDTLRTSSRA